MSVGDGVGAGSMMRLWEVEDTRPSQGWPALFPPGPAASHHLHLPRTYFRILDTWDQHPQTVTFCPWSLSAWHL